MLTLVRQRALQTRVLSLQYQFCLLFTLHFYRAMHFSAKRDIAIACRLSVRPSVRPSVCDVGEL